MAEYSPSKIVKDGNTYNFRDTTKIPLAGSNQISGDLIPSTDGTVNLGGSSYQWNNAYIKSLTINGVACGDILTHNASEFVNVSNMQTIEGVKTFTSNPYIKCSNPFLSLVSMGYVKGVAPSSNMFQGIRFYDDETSSSENHIVGGFEAQYSTSGYNVFNINCRNYDQNNTHLNYRLGLYVPNDSTRPIQFAPAVNNIINLGSITYQWNNTYTRNILIDNDINIASSVINKTSSSGTLALRGGLTTQDGASIGLYGKNYVGALSGCVYMTAYGNSDSTSFRIFPNGAISVTNNSTSTTKNVAMQEDVVPRSGGAVMTGSLLASPTTTTSEIGFGYGWGNGGTIYTYSPTHSTVDWQGTIRLEPLKTTSYFKTMQLAPSGTWTWSGTACQITSDQRYKQQITEIDDKLLDAWEDVELVQFKYNESVDTKGKSARLHTGYVVQQINKACTSHGVDITQYGLYCHEEYPEETKEVEVEQADGTKTKKNKGY